MDALVRKTSPLDERVRKPDSLWVEPRYEADVAFSDVTHDGRVRHPSFGRGPPVLDRAGFRRLQDKLDCQRHSRALRDGREISDQRGGGIGQRDQRGAVFQRERAGKLGGPVGSLIRGIPPTIAWGTESPPQA
jgi:hypothetical protein